VGAGGRRRLLLVGGLSLLLPALVPRVERGGGRRMEGSRARLAGSGREGARGGGWLRLVYRGISIACAVG
jgi:hypothetical protein